MVHRRLWQELISMEMLLRRLDLFGSDECLAWSKADSHPNLQALMAVQMSGVALHPWLHRAFNAGSQHGTLSLLATGFGQGSTQIVLQLLSIEAGRDGVVSSVDSLWSDRAGLRVQWRRLASAPSWWMDHASSVLRCRGGCFAAQGFSFPLEG